MDAQCQVASNPDLFGSAPRIPVAAQMLQFQELLNVLKFQRQLLKSVWPAAVVMQLLWSPFSSLIAINSRSGESGSLVVVCLSQHWLFWVQRIALDVVSSPLCKTPLCVVWERMHKARIRNREFSLFEDIWKFPLDIKRICLRCRTLRRRIWAEDLIKKRNSKQPARSQASPKFVLPMQQCAQL